MAKINTKKKQRKTLFAALMLLLTGILLSASTYAWFTANKTVTVEEIDVNVATSNGLQVSVDGINWKTIISNADINGAITNYTAAKNQLPTGTNTLSPVSTVGALDSNGLMQMYAGEIGSDTNGDQTITATKTNPEVNGTTGHYVAFDLFFQVTADTPLYLTSDSTVAVPEGKTASGIQNAARVAFIVEGSAAAGSTAATVQALKSTTAVPVIWEPNADVHTSAAVQNAANNYNITTTTTGAETIEYYGVKADIPADPATPLASQSSTYFTKMTPQIVTPATGISTAAYKNVFTASAGITKVRIYAWVEGQDVDCENNASGGAVGINLQFSSNSSQA